MTKILLIGPGDFLPKTLKDGLVGKRYRFIKASHYADAQELRCGLPVCSAVMAYVPTLQESWEFLDWMADSSPF